MVAFVTLLVVLAGAEPSAPLPAVLPGLVDVGAALPVQVELKYATTDNFMHKDVYGALKACFLVSDAERMLADALARLQRHEPTLTFVMYDCARPRSVQLLMWDVVKGTKQQGYVADPTRPPGSVHNTGCAVDLSIWDRGAKAPLDMGSPYDFFGAAAEPRREPELLKAGTLTTTQLANRVLLREVMARAGFRPLAHEWWHFDCKSPSDARKSYAVIP